MSQQTLVLQMPRARALALKERLKAGDFDFRPPPQYALFSVKGEGVVATFYESGKVVVQGATPQMFVEHWLDEASPSAPKSSSPSSPAESEIDENVEMIGSDECGKGDYFGPLVVVAVRMNAGQAIKLRAAGVRDSKTLSDEQCLRLGGALRGMVAHTVVRLDPFQYNQVYVQGKLNDLLGNLHVEAITPLAKSGIHVLVDQFANPAVMQKKLAPLGVKLEQRTRAESNPAVAAASIIAREEFLTALKELSEECAVDLHKGAGEPVDRAAARFVAIHGRKGLVKVAKLHFKNTQRVQG